MRRAGEFLTPALALGLTACTSTVKEVNTRAKAPASSSHGTATKPVAHVGATLSLDSGAEQVTLVQVTDPAQGADQYTTPDPGERFVATLFRVTNAGTQALDDDANTDVTLIGSNGQTYTDDANDVSECTNFNDGEIELGPGESATGCVVFQVPTGVAVAKVEWSPSGPFGGEFGEWLVP